MKLAFEQIQSAARGVARVEEIDGQINFFRFTAEQDAYYARRNPDLHLRSRATSGVILEFDTDSESLTLSVETTPGSSRQYTVHSIFINGERIGQLDCSMPEDAASARYSGTFALGIGTKRIKILFPWAVCSKLESLILDDNASFTPVQKNKTILIFGDSITQGYDAEIPENSYAAQLVAHFDANGINKAVGGEVFSPGLAACQDAVTPDLITVAYGTNDWSLFGALTEDACTFYQTLRKLYPNTPMIAMAPIWRADTVQEGHCDFSLVRQHIADIASCVENVSFIDCFPFIPADAALFSDSYLHPNDAGFAYYGAKLIRAIEEKNLM